MLLYVYCVVQVTLFAFHLVELVLYVWHIYFTQDVLPFAQSLTKYVIFFLNNVAHLPRSNLLPLISILHHAVDLC